MERRMKGGWKREDGGGSEKQVGGKADGLRGEQTNENWEASTGYRTNMAHMGTRAHRPKLCQKPLRMGSKDPCGHS